MSAPLARLRRLAAVAILAAGTAGCASLSTLQNVTEPTDLYDLTPKSTFDAGLPEIAAQLVVEEPTAASAVNTDRITVKPTVYQIQYLPRARWVDRAPLLVQSKMVESFESTGKVASVGRQSIGLRADYTLLTELREFQAEVGEGGANAPLTVVVQLNVKIVSDPLGLIVGSKSFGHRETAASNDTLAVVAAFDAALGKAMGGAIDWSVRRIAEVSGGGP